MGVRQTRLPKGVKARPITANLPEDLYNRLLELARKNRRSMSAEATFAIEEYLSEYEWATNKPWITKNSFDKTPAIEDK